MHELGDGLLSEKILWTSHKKQNEFLSQCLTVVIKVSSSENIKSVFGTRREDAFVAVAKAMLEEFELIIDHEIIFNE